MIFLSCKCWINSNDGLYSIISHVLSHPWLCNLGTIIPPHIWVRLERHCIQMSVNWWDNRTCPTIATPCPTAFGALGATVLYSAVQCSAIQGKQFEAKCIILYIYQVSTMQNTVLSFTERSGHLGATSSDHWSWHPLATSEGDKVISWTV